jgi:8-oxo-dGTP pyrophosphatase MutT (NUDIX family)
MPHIHTQPGQHDHTASAYLFRVDMNEPKVLLHMHKKFGKYMQFGGHIELDETPWQAITHELLEESGYSIEQISVLQPKDRIAKLTDAAMHPHPVTHSTHALPNKHFHTDVAYAFTVDNAPKTLPSDGESTDIRSFTRSELVDLPDDSIIENVREIALYIFDHCLANWQPTTPDEFN